MKRGVVGKRFAIGAAGAAIVWMGMGVAPALAFDDKPSTFEPLMNLMGLGTTDDKPQIDFRERPKLVVPKGRDLPPPQTGGGQRAANWPVDQDLQRVREAKALERAPRAININKNPVLDNRELMEGRSNAPGTSPELCESMKAGIPDCSYTPMEKLKRVFSLGSNENTDVVQPGAPEPKREYLTEPPTGYRAATSVQRATNDGPVRKYEAPSAGEYARGVDPNRVKRDD